MIVLVPLIKAVLVFFVAITVNSLSVYLQKHFRIYDRFGRWGIWLHSLIIIPLWFWFIYQSANLHGTLWRIPPSIHLIGYFVSLVATTLFVMSIVKLGVSALVNGNFFNKGRWAKGKLFQYLHNPMYDSFILAFIAVGFIRSQWAYFVLAVISFIGLNLIQSSIEKMDSSSPKTTKK